jgi:hypothetical protein
VQKEDRNEKPARGHHEKWQARPKGNLRGLWHDGTELSERKESLEQLASFSQLSGDE